MKLIRVAGMFGLIALAGVGSRFAAAQVSTGAGGGGGSGAGPGASAGTSTGWYGGLSIGQSRAKIDDARITSTLLGAGFTSTSITHDDRDTGYKVFAGYRINRNFALEGGFFDLGKFGFTATTVPAGALNATNRPRGGNRDTAVDLAVAERVSALGGVETN